MRAYNNDATLKARVLAGLAAHRAADEIRQGIYWRDNDNERGGCAIGCVLHDLDPSLRPDDHYRFERQLGVPIQIAYMIDHIFESQPSPEAAAAWSLRVMDAIPVGADLTGVWPQCRPLYSSLRNVSRRPDALVALLAAAPVEAVQADPEETS
jgi:hypothetical protein